MAVYQKKFVLNGRSNTDFGLIVCAITPDDGETDSYLTMESIYTESFDGSRRRDYGAKYTETVVLYITMLKNNYADFTRKELRETLDWLTGLRKTSWLDLYNDDNGKISFSFLGRVTDVKLQKLDARIVGLKVEFTSVSPWAYSGINHNEMSLNGNSIMYQICNSSDEVGVYVYPNVTFINKTPNGTLKIANHTTGADTIIRNLGMNEVINLDSNKTIYSDKPAKIFGDDFNFNWLRFARGYNHIEITGVGHLIIEHRDMLKVADAFDDNLDMNTTPAMRNLLLRAKVSLPASNWELVATEPGVIATYSQPVYHLDVTRNSKINLQATADQTLDLQASDIEIQIINDNGSVTAYAYGGAPVIDYVFQATIEETDVEISRRYGTIQLYANGWIGQGSIYTQPVYIKDITKNSIIDIDLSDAQIEQLEGSEITLFINNDKGTAIAYALGFKPNIDYNVDIIITETTSDVTLARRRLDDGLIYAEPLYF